MSNIVQYDIAPWRDDVFSFGGAVAFAHKQSGNTFLISPIGTSIILSSDLITQLVEKKPSEMLRQKLNARGFDGTKQRPSVCNATKYEPEFLMIDITTKCNMNCFYCLRHFEDSGNNISDETLAKILEYIVEYYRLTRKPLTIQPWGGEPLVALEKIFFIYDYLKKADVRFHLLIQTNGILLTDEVARQLHDRNIDVGVSIDGCQTIHDMHRKDLGYQPTYDKVCDGIKHLKQYYGTRFGTISVISRDSMMVLEESFDVLVKDLGISTLKFNFLHPNTDLFDMSNVLDDSCIYDFWKRVIDKLLSLNNEGFNCLESNLFDKLLNLLIGSCGDICHSNGCTGGYNLVSFSQEGDIFPCEMIGNDEYRMGNIAENIPLPELIKANSQHNRYFCEKKSDKCSRCPWKCFCRGGCTAAARFYGKNVGEIDPKECASNCVLYPLLIETVLSDIKSVELLTNRKISNYN